uniref:Uncharacterized protein n=1 Tax=Glossina palpalis gambiensis TaxID=67801 RepID=A0A1B0BXR7_9MUSC
MLGVSILRFIQLGMLPAAFRANEMSKSNIISYRHFQRNGKRLSIGTTMLPYSDETSYEDSLGVGHDIVARCFLVVNGKFEKSD